MGKSWFETTGVSNGGVRRVEFGIARRILKRRVVVAPSPYLLHRVQTEDSR
jgi:hypothetical protein